MRRLFCLALVLAVVGIASAVTATNLLTNPGFEYMDGSMTGWNTWNAVDEGAWGDDKSPTITFPNDAVSGDYSVMMDGTNGFSQQYGIYQVVEVPVGVEVRLTGMWKGNLGGDGWAELKMTTCAAGVVYPNFAMDATKNYVAKIDTYGPINERPGGVWDWESTTLAPLSGNTIVSLGQVIVYTEIGGWGSASVLQLDDMVLEVVPEPMTIALLGLGALGLIRRKK